MFHTSTLNGPLLVALEYLSSCLQNLEGSEQSLLSGMRTKSVSKGHNINLWDIGGLIPKNHNF